jgi:hypothetical protein
MVANLSVITSLRAVVIYSLCPGHKCPGYIHPPPWGERKAMQTSNRTTLENSYL